MTTMYHDQEDHRGFDRLFAMSWPVLVLKILMSLLVCLVSLALMQGGARAGTSHADKVWQTGEGPAGDPQIIRFRFLDTARPCDLACADSPWAAASETGSRPAARPLSKNLAFVDYAGPGRAGATWLRYDIASGTPRDGRVGLKLWINY